MKWPEKIDCCCDRSDFSCLSCEGYKWSNATIDDCRRAVEEAVSVEKIANLLYSRASSIQHIEDLDFEDFINDAQAIRKQIMDELFGGER